MSGKMSKNGDASSELKDMEKAPRQPVPSDTPANSHQNAIQKHVKTQKFLKKLRPNVLRQIGSFLSIKEMQTAERELSKPTGRFRLFQSMINELSVLNDVITGNLESLIDKVRGNPELLFIKSETITSPAGQIFYNVCPYQMMLFLYDDDMLTQVMHAVSPLQEKFVTKINAIHASLQQGGADLIKLNADPRLLNFEDVLRFRTQYMLYDNKIIRATFPLLENPDGVLYYKDEHEQEHWYYANQTTRIIEPIELAPILTLQQQKDYANLVTKMNAMEPMSARRSSNNEHQFIANNMRYLANVKTMTPVTLVRQGITYIQDGIRYRDTHHDFNRYTNAYRKRIDIYQDASWRYAIRGWERELWHAQKEVMWLLQRYCEKNRSFNPLSLHYKTEPFQRGFKFSNWTNGRLMERYDIYNVNTGFFYTEKSLSTLSSNFALYKDTASEAQGDTYNNTIDAIYNRITVTDLIAVTQLIEDAKTTVVALVNSNLTQQGPAPC